MLTTSFIVVRSFCFCIWLSPYVHWLGQTVEGQRCDDDIWKKDWVLGI